ncbi:MAG: response regulator, partial [Lachnospiraceae bacterium]|nr:response regulator [Lachnospiraceae bacterium]
SEIVMQAGKTLLGLVNDILDFSKIEAGKIDIVPVQYDLSLVINDLVNMIKPRAEDKGLTLKLDFDRKLPRGLFGDEVRIKQVITNILTNAVKYTEKGSVTFRIGYDDLDVFPEQIMLNVSVKDTGIGIKPEDMPKLFSEFERIEEERNRNIEGTGLGMSITWRLLDLMGSKLMVDSTYGVGSTFSFSLKQRVINRNELGDSYNAYQNKRKKYETRFTAPEARILVIDDTEMNLMVFKSLLKKTFIQIDTACSGDEGLKYAAGDKYDIVFIDHMMPGKDGIETLHDLKGSGEGPNKATPAICLTANAISGAREKYLSEGFDDYITKPIDPTALEEIILKYLPRERVNELQQ